MASERQRYLAYMLRLWQVGEEEPVWRASLEDAHEGARHAFASIRDMLAFLEEKTGQPPCTRRDGSLSRSEGGEAEESEPAI